MGQSQRVQAKPWPESLLKAFTKQQIKEIHESTHQTHKQQCVIHDTNPLTSEIVRGLRYRLRSRRI